MDIQGLKDKILQLAIQGKLVEQDKNDEPASVLLERIKEERDKLVKEKKIKKPKPLPEITDEEKPFEIPDSWEWVRLGEVGLTQTGTTPSTKHPEYFNGTIPFIKPADISEKGIDYNNESLTELGLLKGRLIEKNSVLMVCIGGSIGKCYFTNRDVSCNQQINTITPYKAVSNKILYYFMISDFFYNSVLKSATGTATPIINKSKWDMLLIPLPPFAEQKRIVEKVDQLFALIDELDSNKEDLLEVINLTRNQVLQEAIQGKLVEQNPEDEPASLLLERIKEERDKLVKEGKIRKPKKLPPIEEEEKPFDIPKGWEWVRLGEVGQIVGGGTPKTSVKEYWEGGTIPWLTPADLSNYKDKYISTGKRSITPLGLKESSAQLMPKGTVLFSSRAPIGYTVIAKNEISTNQGFKSCVPFIIEMNEYLYYYLVYSAKIINENASVTTFKEVSGAEVSNLILPLPPLTEQKRIVEKVDMIMNMLDELEKTII
jgi:type I restriction enzyme S subunit